MQADSPDSSDLPVSPIPLVAAGQDKAFWREAIQSAPPLTPSVSLAEPTTPPHSASPASPALENVSNGLWNWALPIIFFLSFLVLVLYAVPFLLAHWRLTEAQAEAEATFLKRRAELKAEAEHADLRLDLLDKRVQLTSLGFREVVRKVTLNVVNVINLREPKGGEGFGGKRMLIFDPDNERKYVEHGVGSGILVKPGYVLTNFHVINQARRLRVTFASGRSIGVDPDAIAADPVTDLAVVRLPSDLPANLREDINVTTPFADSDIDVQVGDWALAVGSPLGLRQTVTQGVVSAKGRLLHMLDLVELLQTDAAINPGNSGGPLFDQHGRIMGINVAIASDNGGNQGIGFAIPSNTAKKIFEQLSSAGEVTRGYLGILLEDVTGASAKALGLGDQGAVRLKLVEPNQAADKAGLQAGDIVTRFNNEALSGDQPVRQFRQLVGDTNPHGEITLEIMRDGEKRSFPVKVGKRPVNVR